MTFMVRILVVSEDYNEMIFFQSLLRKVGFDVEATNNPLNFSSLLLSFNPKVLLLTADGKRVKGLDLIKKIRKKEGWPKIILIRENESIKIPTEFIVSGQVDDVLEAPVTVKKLLVSLASASELDSESLKKMLGKISAKKNKESVEERLQVVGSIEENIEPQNKAEYLLGSEEPALNSNKKVSSKEKLSSDTEEVSAQNMGASDAIEIIQEEIEDILSAVDADFKVLSLRKGKTEEEIEQQVEETSGLLLEDKKERRDHLVSETNLRSSIAEEERVNLYEKYENQAQDVPPDSGGFPFNEIKQANRQNREEQVRISKEQKLQEIKLDAKKKAFVEALYSHLKKE